MIVAQYGEDVWDALCMYIQLDAEDRAEVRGMMKGLYRNEKYSKQEGLKHAQGKLSMQTSNRNTSVTPQTLETPGFTGLDTDVTDKRAVLLYTLLLYFIYYLFLR